MFSFLPPIILFPINFCLHVLNVIFWGSVISSLGVIKFLLPLALMTRMLNLIINLSFKGFAVFAVGIINLTNKVHWDYKVEGKLKKKGWYLMLSNHTSWLDIILLTHFTVGRIPTAKFFLKKELLWMPFVGISAWAMDMPFMRRYSRQFIQKNPHLKGKDIEATKRSCEKYKYLPTTMINFVEGTRITSEKQQSSQSEYTHLLPPKAGGIAFTLATMGELFSDIIDITLLYPESEHVMFDMLKGDLTMVVLHAKVQPVTTDIIGDYFNNQDFKQQFQQWLNKLWRSKDKYIAQLLANR